jgi:hypothetical protein
MKVRCRQLEIAQAGHFECPVVVSPR